MPHPTDTLARFAEAVNELLGNAGFRYANPGEQAVTGELSRLMSPRFADWSVCAEWNRKQQEQKMLHYGLDGEVAKLRAIRPDIIVHTIGAKDNILVVEAKRVENRDVAQDVAKLRAMTNPEGAYFYEVGVRLTLDLATASIPDCEVFVAGESERDLTDFLRNLLPDAADCVREAAGGDG